MNIRRDGTPEVTAAGNFLGLGKVGALEVTYKENWDLGFTAWLTGNVPRYEG